MAAAVVFCDHLYPLVYFSVGFVVDFLGTKCRQEGCRRYPPCSYNCCGASVYLSSLSVRLRSLRLWAWVHLTTSFVNSHSYSGRSDEQVTLATYTLFAIWRYYISLSFECYQPVGPYISCSIEGISSYLHHCFTTRKKAVGVYPVLRAPYGLLTDIYHYNIRLEHCIALFCRGRLFRTAAEIVLPRPAMSPR